MGQRLMIIVNQKGETPLHRVIHGKLSILELLLKRGADPNLTNSHGCIPVLLCHTT